MRTLPLLPVVISALAAAAGPAVAETDHATRAAAARAATMELIQKLGATLQQEMKTAGPAAAITVCRDVAPQIAGELSRHNGWRVTRVSDKVRNPMLGTPDAWESQVLQQFHAQRKAGSKPAEIEFSEVVTEADGKEYFRYMKAIGTKPVCLTCHGDPAQMPAEVKQAISASYPHDRATGYSAGEIRGAVSIKQPMDIPLMNSGEGS